MLVIGHGPAGRAAAGAAREAGRDVLVVDTGPADRTTGPATVAARAGLLDPHHVALTGLGVDAGAGRTVVRAGKVIIATGTGPMYPQVNGLADTKFMIAVGAHRMVPSDRPLGPADDPLRGVATLRPGNGPLPFELSDLAGRSVAVLGAGRTGSATAWALGVLGAQVTLVEAADRVLPRWDPTLSEAVGQALEEAGVRVMLRARVSGLAPTLDEGAWIGTEDAGDVAAEHLVLATGHRPLTTGLDLRAAGIRPAPSGAVPVDRECRTTARSVLAAGEVTGCPREAAAWMGRFVGENAASGRRLRRPAWHEPALPVGMLLPAAGRRRAVEVAQIGSMEDPGKAAAAHGPAPGPVPRRRNIRFPQGGGTGRTAPSVVLARPERPRGGPPSGLALAGEGATALAAAATANLAGAVDTGSFAQIVGGTGELGRSLALALLAEDVRVPRTGEGGEDLPGPDPGTRTGRPVEASREEGRGP